MLLTRSILLFLCLSGISCSPASPDEFVVAAIESISTRKAAPIWYALPASYQNDIEQGFDLFTTHIQAEHFDRCHQMLVKLSQLFDEKSAAIAHFLKVFPLSPLTSHSETELQVTSQSIAKIIELLADGKTTSKDGLKAIDLNHFFKNHLGDLLAEVSILTEQLGNKNSQQAKHRPFSMFTDPSAAKIEILKLEENTATIAISFDQNPAAEKWDMTRVEGKWVPTAIASNWQNISRIALSWLKALPTDAAKTQRFLNQASLLESHIENSMAASSTKEFHQEIGQVFLLLAY